MAPEGALRCRAVASGLPGRSAGCISALGESARNLWMRRPEVKNAEETTNHTAKLCSFPSPALAGVNSNGNPELRAASPQPLTRRSVFRYSRSRTRKAAGRQRRIAHANHAGAVDRAWTDRRLCRSDMVAAVGWGLSQPSGQLHRAVRPRRRHRHPRAVDRPKAFRPLRQSIRGGEPPRRRHGDRRRPSREKRARRLHHHGRRAGPWR